MDTCDRDELENYKKELIVLVNSIPEESIAEYLVTFTKLLLGI